MFLSADDPTFDAFVSHCCAELFDDLLYDLFLTALAFLKGSCEHSISKWMEVFKAEIFQLHFESIDTEAVGDRCIDVERFSGDTLLLVSGHRAECLHVVQTVGELDEDDANVFDHREHHFPKAFGLSLCLTAKLNLIQLADTIDEQRDFATELLSRCRRAMQ